MRPLPRRPADGASGWAELAATGMSGRVPCAASGFAGIDDEVGGWIGDEIDCVDVACCGKPVRPPDLIPGPVDSAPETAVAGALVRFGGVIFVFRRNSGTVILGERDESKK